MKSGQRSDKGFVHLHPFRLLLTRGLVFHTDISSRFKRCYIRIHLHIHVHSREFTQCYSMVPSEVGNYKAGGCMLVGMVLSEPVRSLALSEPVGGNVEGMALSEPVGGNVEGMALSEPVGGMLPWEVAGCTEESMVLW